MKVEVFCRTRFEALHCWPAAPTKVEFLRTPHRHEFHVEVHVPVKHSDRDVEFIMLKWKVDDAINELRTLADTSNFSCEMYARELLVKLGASRVMVSEDGENGAWVYA